MGYRDKGSQGLKLRARGGAGADNAESAPHTKQIHFNNVTGEAESLCERMRWGGGVNTSERGQRGREGRLA